MQNGIMYSGIITKPLESGRSFFLFGPRGTGKTTWLKAKFPDSLHLGARREYHGAVSVLPVGKAMEVLPSILAPL